MILIDTSAWIAFFRDRAPLAEKVAKTIADGDAVLCGPVLTELMRGFRPEERRIVLPLLETLGVLDDPPGLWRAAGELGFRLARKGKTTKTLDLLIASYALHYGVALLTDDADFRTIAAAGVPLTLAR